MPFFFQNTTNDLESLNQQISAATLEIYNKLTNQNTQVPKIAPLVEELISLLRIRTESFKNQLIEAKKNNNRAEVEKILRGYLHFLQTILACLDHQELQKREQIINTYFYSSDYIHIGGREGENSATSTDELTFKVALICGTLMALTLCLSPLNFSLALIATTLNLILFIPSIYYYLTVTCVNKELVKNEENTVFLAAENLAAAQNHLKI